MRHYSGEVENVYMIFQQIYSRNRIPYFIRIARFLWKILQEKHFGHCFFSGHTVHVC